MTNVKPTDQGFKVALEALSKDSGVWQGCGDLLAHAASNAERIQVPTAAFTLFATFYTFDVKGRYDALRTFFIDRTKEGAATHHAIATNLQDARTTYMRADEQARHDFYKTW